MACNPDFVQYVADQCAGAGEIVTKKMFGGYCIYCNGKIFGLICNDGPGAKDYFFIADVDDRDYLAALVRSTCRALPEPKPKKRKTK